MKLVHFSDKPVKLLPSYDHVLKQMADEPPKVDYKVLKERVDGRRYFKPVGLWISDEDAKMSWSEWCKSEGFRDIDKQYAYEIKLKSEANILYLETALDIYDFTLKYAYKDSKINNLGGRSYVHEIDWPRVEKEYQGIIITPYQWECRMPPQTMWYYSWDCASGCIWDVEAIQSFEQIRKGKGVKKVPARAKRTKA